MSTRWQVTNPVRRHYEVEVDGRKWSGVSVEKVFVSYMAWLTTLDTPPPADWEEKVWMALAKAYPRHIRRTRGKKRFEGVTIAAAMTFIGFMLKQLGRRKLVSPEVAHARAARCKRCPVRAEVLGCSVCKQALKAAVHPPEEVDAPQACYACKCYMPLKVWIPRDLLGDADAFPYASACWMRDDADLLHEGLR